MSHLVLETRAAFAHQLRFVDTFFEPSARRELVLTSPVGMGGSYALVLLCARVAASARRPILFLVPAAHVAQVLQLLRSQTGWHGEVIVLDRETLRSFKDTVREEDRTSPSRIFLSSIDFAKRTDVASVIVAASWALVLADEAHGVGGQRAQLFDALQRSERVDRLVLSARSQVPESLRNATVVEWTRDTATHEGRPLFAAREVRIVNYVRTAEERRTLEALERLAVCVAPSCGLEALTLFSAAASSAPALEEVLLRFRERLKGDVDPGVWEDSSADLLTSDGGGIPDARDIEGDAATLLAVEYALRTVDNIYRDPKLDALVDLLRALNEPVIVLTSYVRTLLYMQEEITGRVNRVNAVHGGVAAENRFSAIDDFRRNGGILLTTHAIAPFLPTTRTARLLVNYDIPASAEQLERRWSLVEQPGAAEGPIMFRFVDESSALPYEQTLDELLDGPGSDSRKLRVSL